MNIVFVFDGLQVGGIERVGVDYIKLLSQRGHKISVVNVTPSLTAFYDQLPESCEIYEIKLPKQFVPYRYAKGIEKGICGAVIYAGIAVILQTVISIHKLIARLNLQKLKNTDIVIAFSGHFPDLMFTACGYLPGKKIAWLHGAEFEYQILNSGYFALYRKIKNLVCLSEFCDYICKKYNDENGIHKVKIYNPILIQDRPIDKEKVAALKHQYGQFVLMAGRLAPDKDQKTAILAIKHLNQKRTDPVHLLLAGDGVNRHMLENFTSEQGAEAYVHFLGNCLDMQNYFSAAYVYVHSSPAEGLPTVLLEALTYEVPIASTDSMPGVREILGNSEYGLISPVGDYLSLAMNIEEVYGNHSLRQELKAKGKERIKDFSPELAIKKLDDFLNSI